MDWIILIVSVIGFVVIMRLLRRRFKWIDYVCYISLFAVPIVLGVLNGFWSGLVAFFVLGGIYLYLLGLFQETTIRRDGATWNVRCMNCFYHDLEIIDEEEVFKDNKWITRVKVRCLRCGDTMWYNLK